MITVSDSGIMVNDANVISADIEASIGVIHVIDKVLLPPPTETDDMTEEPVDATLAPTASMAEEPVDPDTAGASIVDIAAESDDFSTLVAALTAAGLVDVIAGEGPFTVFGTCC